MCEGGLFADPRGSTCFAREDGQKSFGPSPAHQQRDGRDAEEKCTAAANKLHRIRKARSARRARNRLPRHVTRRSSASFETKRRLPAVFQGLPSWVESVAHERLFGENKIVRRFCTGSPVGCSRKEHRRHACRYNSSSGSVRACLVKTQKVLPLRSSLAQTGTARRNVWIVRVTSGPALLSCDGTQAEDGEDYRYSRGHDCFGR